MESLPDLGSLSDKDLKRLIAKLEKEGHQVSHERRILQGKIDILRAELVARLQRSGGQVLGGEGGESALVRRWPRRPLGSGSVALELPEKPDDVDAHGREA